MTISIDWKDCFSLYVSFLFLKYFVYLFDTERQTEREYKQGEAAEGEQASC